MDYQKLILFHRTEASIAPGFALITGMFYTREEQPARQAAWFCGNSIAVLLGVSTNPKQSVKTGVLTKLKIGTDCVRHWKHSCDSNCSMAIAVPHSRSHHLSIWDSLIPHSTRLTCQSHLPQTDRTSRRRAKNIEKQDWSHGSRKFQMEPGLDGR